MSGYKIPPVFIARYEYLLARDMERNPENYSLLEPKTVVERMVKAIETKGVRGVNINSPTWKQLAKEYGIKNNAYSRWHEFFKTVKL